MLTAILIGLTRGALVIWFLVAALMVLSYQGLPRDEQPKHWPLGAFIWPLLFVALLWMIISELVGGLIVDPLRRLWARLRRGRE